MRRKTKSIFDIQEEDVNEQGLKQSERIKIMQEYLTTYRSFLVLHQGMSASRDLEDIDAKAKKFAHQALLDAIDISGISDLVDKIKN